MLQSTKYDAGAYLKWFWDTHDFNKVMSKQKLIRTRTAKLLVLVLSLGMAAQIILAVHLAILAAQNHSLARWLVAIAVFLLTPALWGHLIVIPLFLGRWFIVRSKHGVANHGLHAGLANRKALKMAVAAILGWQVRRLKKKNNFQVVAVAGSIGKTSTKLAIASVLKAGLRVQYQDGNYNDLVSVPLIFFGEKIPSLFNPFAWLAVFWRNESQLRRSYPYDVVVLELGTDGPGQMKQFERYLKVDIGVLTSIVPEHMVFFKDLDEVASEETNLDELSTLTLANKDLIASKYLSKLLGPVLTYATKQTADFQIINAKFTNESCDFEFSCAGQSFLQATHELIAEPQLYSVTAAIAVAIQLGLDAPTIKKGLANIKPVSGRMQRLKGVNNSLIIDDTYNASPDATKAALDTLYRIKSAHKIAVLGNMNELGDYSQAAHEEIGKYCDPNELELVLTIGPDANKYLAPAAEAKDCKVITFDNPYTAGDYLKPIIKDGSVILVKGSQNRVFAEETIKSILANSKDESKLVRQNEGWLSIKSKAFKA